MEAKWVKAKYITTECKRGFFFGKGRVLLRACRNCKHYHVDNKIKQNTDQSVVTSVSLPVKHFVAVMTVCTEHTTINISEKSMYSKEKACQPTVRLKRCYSI